MQPTFPPPVCGQPPSMHDVQPPSRDQHRNRIVVQPEPDVALPNVALSRERVGVTRSLLEAAKAASTARVPS